MHAKFKENKKLKVIYTNIIYYRYHCIKYINDPNLLVF